MCIFSQSLSLQNFRFDSIALSVCWYVRCSILINELINHEVGRGSRGGNDRSHRCHDGRHKRSFFPYRSTKKKLTCDDIDIGNVLGGEVNRPGVSLKRFP